MSDKLPHNGSSPFRLSDEDLLGSDEYDDDHDISEGSVHVPAVPKDDEVGVLRNGTNQTKDLEPLVQNHDSSTASKTNPDLSWSWPNVGYASLKQWASTNNLTTFPTNDLPSSKDAAAAVPYKDSLSYSYTQPSPVSVDTAWNVRPFVSNNDESLEDFGNGGANSRNKRSSSVGRKRGRSEVRSSARVGVGQPLAQGSNGDVFEGARSVAEEGGYEKIKEEWEEEEGKEINDKDHLSCHVCNFIGLKEEDFRAHMAIHFRQRCPLCDYTCRTAGRLRRHTKEYHQDRSPSTSDTLAVVATTAPLNLGAVRDAGLRKNYHCRHCEYSTVERDNYWEHKLVHIPLARQLRCPYDCKFVTDLKHHLVYHLLNHSGTKPYHCDRCSYDCINKSMLNSHMKSHSNYYPYRCFHCSFASKYPHPMKVHERKRGHKRIQLNLGSKKVALNNCSTDFTSGTSPVKSETKAIIRELVSPIGSSSQAAPKKRIHKKIERSSSQFQSQPQAPMTSSFLPNYPQFPMGFAPTGGGYYFPGYFPFPMFSPFAARFPVVGGGLPQTNGANESWFSRKALTSGKEDSQFKSNPSIVSPMKSVGGGGINNSVQVNLLQSMNLIQSNVMFNFSRNYIGGGGGVGVGSDRSGVLFTQPLKCSLCYFVANTAVGLLQHTMIAHTTTSLSNNAARSSADYFEPRGTPISQSTPVKQPKLLSENARMTGSRNLEGVPAKDKRTPERYAVSTSTMFPQALHTPTLREEYDRMLTNEITASIDRERKKRSDHGYDFKREENLTNSAPSAKYGLKLECAENGDSKKMADVSILSARSQSRMSSASPDDDIAAMPYTPVKQRLDSISKLDLISSRLQQSRQHGSGSSQGYHTTSNLSSSSTKETSANSAASWPLGSPTSSPQEIGTPMNESRCGNGKFVPPAHSSGCKPRKILLAEDTDVDGPEDLSLAGRERTKDQTSRTPPSSGPTVPSVIRCLNEQFGVADVSPEVGKCRTSKPEINNRLSFPPPSHDTRIGQYPYECHHCKVLFSDYAMYSLHMAHH